MKSQEEQFLEELNQHAGIVHRICKSYFPDEELRKDAYQEIIYQLWKSYPGFKGLSKFSTWMYKIALNTAITFNQKSRKHSLHATLDESMPVPAATDRHDDREDIDLLYAGINTLSEMEKAVILLYLEAHSYEEIAGITGLTKTNVSVKLTRIKKKLEHFFKHQTYTSWTI